MLRKASLRSGQDSHAKKTPLGERGIRVIVVVANSVSVSAYGLWWIIIILRLFLLLLFILILVDPLSSGFDSENQISIALHHRNLFVRSNI